MAKQNNLRVAPAGLKAVKSARPSRRRTSRKGGRVKDPVGTRRDILRAATIEFTRYGLSGARVDRIARQASSNKRMIYYYFKSKESLYRAVLEEAYRGIREREMGTDFENLSPVDSIRAMVAATLSYEELHPEFVSLVSTENIHRAKYMTKTAELQKTNQGIIQALEKILERGRETNLFRTDVDAIDVHVMISALCFFRMANRFTFKAVFNHDMMKASERARTEDLICDAVLGFLAPKRYSRS